MDIDRKKNCAKKSSIYCSRVLAVNIKKVFLMFHDSLCAMTTWYLETFLWVGQVLSMIQGSSETPLCLPLLQPSSLGTHLLGDGGYPLKRLSVIKYYIVNFVLLKKMGNCCLPHIT